jgi:hypothetical protein
MGGLPLATVAKYVGHSTVQMTMRYSHLVPFVNHAAADMMDAYYGEDTIMEQPPPVRKDFHRL